MNQGQQIVLRLLDWPFLAFLILLVLTVAFRRQLGEALRRGDIQISWGENRSIRLGQLSASLDEELDPIRDDIDGSKKAITAIEAKLNVENVPRVEPNNVDALSGEQRETARRCMEQALSSGKYLWRSIERLAVIGGVSESQALDILRADSAVRLSLGKSGRQIARLVARSE